MDERRLRMYRFLVRIGRRKKEDVPEEYRDKL